MFVRVVFYLYATLRYYVIFFQNSDGPLKCVSFMSYVIGLVAKKLTSIVNNVQSLMIVDTN